MGCPACGARRWSTARKPSSAWRVRSSPTVFTSVSPEIDEVRITSRDWRADPIIEFNLLSDRRDLDRLMDAFRRLGAMQMSAALAEATSDPFPASYTERVRKIGVVSSRNKMITDVIAKLLDGPAWLRRMMVEKVIVAGYRFDEL